MNPDEGLNFTWWPSFTEAAAQMPEGDRAKFLWGVIQYGTYGNEPFFEYPLNSTFEGMRPNLDSSRKRSAGGKKGSEKRWGGEKG